MPKYKLTYFSIRGRAELIRLLFAQAGVDFEDHRITGADWPTLKPTMPTETLPVLEIDGKTLPQSQAIARYVAREFNLAGSNNLEMAQCEAVIESLVDMGNEILPIFVEKDEAKKAELKQPTFEKIKTKLKHVENALIANGGEVFVGKTITIADIAFFARIDFLHVVSDDPLKDFPKLAALKDKVAKEPRIAAWVAKRPVTKM